jgi:hypothetical protein
MKTTVSRFGALLVALACCGAARADHHWLSCFRCRDHADGPNAFGWGSCLDGSSYGSNFSGPQLPPMPFNGMPPSGAALGAFGGCKACGAGGAGAGRNPCYYPYMRGPRDYFMIDLR